MGLCSSVCDIKAPEGIVKWGIWECRNKSEMRLLPSSVATKGKFLGNAGRGRKCSSVGFFVADDECDVKLIVLLGRKGVRYGSSSTSMQQNGVGRTAKQKFPSD